MEGAGTATNPYSENARPRFEGSKESAMMACAMGCNPPPPTPWNTRKSNRRLRVGAMPQRKELSEKITKQSIKKRFRPTTLAAHAPIGSTIAFATRYEVSPQVL